MIQANNVSKLRDLVIEAIASPDYIHHSWYTEYHMFIVEKIALEACELYPKADHDKVLSLIWIHDYEKIIDFAQKDNRVLAATKQLLANAEYRPEVIDELVCMTNILNEKNDIANTQIEIQIVSSADGASHVIGPFMDIYWYENPNMSISEIQAGNRKKIMKDWDLKITIPEIREAFESRRIHELEATGELPEKYLG